MRITGSIFVGSIAVLAIATAPAPAKNANLNSHANAHAQKIEDKPAAQGCHAYQKAADGSWVELPRQDVGPPRKRRPSASPQPELRTKRRAEAQSP